ncbi:ATP-dependent zinc metalloprotease FtsH [Tepidibacillus fermentans]|uniref:ATP-dependent zinc metalloprotease FtsH n=1 Tax=Tepidibacillus fermentans TaxID=1281767 RepID=A0A4R3KAL7_9BACI|nr:ATP-dependent zinc metalloprotease FtsH [Tepidibacillus fermentans]TCS80144.1 cell division protease FtsH [Tepidibacillus fermentans]
MNRFLRNTGFYLLILLLTVGIVSFITKPGIKTEQIPFTQFQKELMEGKYSQITARPDGLTFRIEGVYADTTPTNKKEFYTNVPFSEGFLNTLTKAPVKELRFLEPKKDSIWITFLTSIIPFILIFVLFFFLLNQAQGGGSKVMNFGKSRARLYNEEKKKVTFNDVAGADEEKAELEEIVEYLQDPRKFASLGARIPKGVLLVGPPGTGKTLLARAVAGEANVPFFSISGSDFVEMFVGVGASRVRDLFDNAKKNSPCIIFIDEIDAVGRQRGAGLGGGHDEREQTLNQLLVEMDGFGANEGIIIIAATNRPDILDPALLRPGRFDRQITVDRPDVKGREEILKVHARNKPLADDLKLDVLARRTPGFTGADLENVLNEAALLAARKGRKNITMQEVDEAIDRVIAGPEKKSRMISDKEKRIVAYHEAGHTIVGYHLEHADQVHKVTVVPRGSAGGYTVMLPKEDRYFMTKPELLDKIVGLLGGRVAEEIVLGEVSTGAHNDFERATGIARRMVTEFGMSEKLGPMQFGHGQGQVFLGRDFNREPNYSDKIAYEIDMEIKRIIDESYKRCKEVLQAHRDELELVAQTLMVKETLDADEIRQLIENGKLADEKINREIKIQIQGKENRQDQEVQPNDQANQDEKKDE